MKNIIKIILLSLTLMPLSCVVSESKKAEEEGTENGASAGNGNGAGSNARNTSNSISPLVETVQVKSFNQINMTMSKMTGVSRAEDDIRDVVTQVLNQLPSDNQLEGMTPFHQISITRLAFSYCSLFVDTDSEFSNINYGSISDTDIKDRLITRFLDIAPSNDPERYDVLSDEIIGVLENTGTDSTGPLVDASLGSRAVIRERLTKMSCTLILSSPFVILI